MSTRRLAKVQMFGTAKAAVVDLSATNGAVVGTNLFWSDGSLVKREQLLGGTATSSDAPGTTDELEEGQYHLYFTDRRAQDAVGAILADTTTIDLSYTGGASITATLKDLADSGAGALLAITRDAQGRITGTRAATITGTAGHIKVDHGDASDGLPTIDLDPSVVDLLALLSAIAPNLRATDAGAYRVTDSGAYRSTQ